MGEELRHRLGVAGRSEPWSVWLQSLQSQPPRLRNRCEFSPNLSSWVAGQPPGFPLVFGLPYFTPRFPFWPAPGWPLMPPDPTPETKSTALHSLLNQSSQLCKIQSLYRTLFYVTCHNSPLPIEPFPELHTCSSHTAKCWRLYLTLTSYWHLSVACHYPESPDP